MASTSGSRFRLFDWVRRWPPAVRQRVQIAAIAVFGIAVLAVAFRQPMSDRIYPEARTQQLLDSAKRALGQGKLTSADGTGARELYVAALALDPDRDEAREGLQLVGAAALARAAQATDAKQFTQAHASLRLARELAVPVALADTVAERLRKREADSSGIEQLLAQAAAARASGDLDGSPRSALPLYRRILALQPTREEALEGREDALADLLQQAEEKRAGGDSVAAAAIVSQVRAYDPGHVGLPDAQAAVTQARDRERTRADAALKRGQLAEAGAGYRAMLALDAEDADAREGLSRTAVAWADRARRQAADFDFDVAERSLRQARDLDPESPAIAEAERQLAQSRARRNRLPLAVLTAPAAAPSPQRVAEVRRLLAQAAEAEARGDILSPPGDSAYDVLRRARAIAPNDPAVQSGIARLLPAARRCFDEELRANRLPRAQGCLDARQQLGDSTASVLQGRNRLALRWLAIGEESLRAGGYATAQRALDTARRLDPDAEGLEAFAQRLRAAGATEARR